MVLHNQLAHLGPPLRLVGPLAVAACCLALLAGQLDGGTLSKVPEHLAAISFWQVGLAAAFTILSFYAVGRYDVVAHRHMGIQTAAALAHWSGTVAIALSQTIGFGLFSSAAARWRMLPGLTLTDALRLAGFVSVTFLAALCVVCATVIFFLTPEGWQRWPAMLVLLALPVGALLLLRFPRLRIGRFNIRLPSPPAIWAIGIWTFVDTLTAAGALWALMPQGTISFAALLPVFLIALAAALISGAPGGVGPFELVVISLLPHHPDAALLAGIILFRLIYFAIPALVAGLALLVPLRIIPPGSPSMRLSEKAHLRAETGVIQQNGGTLEARKDAIAAVWETGHSRVVLFDPAPHTTAAFLAQHRTSAFNRNQLPILYKCTGRTAASARRSGWKILHIADEAIIDPAALSFQGRHRRGLRRKLRQAEGAGVSVCMQAHLPLTQMARVDRAWQARNGSAWGGSMGRFCPDYLEGQRVYLAYQGAQLVGFVSFHTARHEWCLDLVRSVDNAPSGMVHSLIATAIADAASLGMPRVSLASAPCKTGAINGLPVRVGAAFQPHGLRQFKQDFGPRWVPLYAAAPNRLALWLGLADIAMRIQRPFPLASPYQPHNEDEDYEVASTTRLCEEPQVLSARKAASDDQPILRTSGRKRRATG